MHVAPSKDSMNTAAAPAEAEALVGMSADAPRQESVSPGAARRSHDASTASEKALFSLYVVGGQQQSLRPLHAGMQSWYRYNKGIILEVRRPGYEVAPVLEYVSPPEVCPPENPAILFKQATLLDQ